MQTLERLVEELKEFKTGLVKLNSNIHSCNQLHEYTSNIIQFMRRNDVDQNRIDPYIPQLEEALCRINPQLRYGLTSNKSKKIFNGTQAEVYEILDSILSWLNTKLKKD